MERPSVLVVEDDDAIRGLLVEYLGQRARLHVDSVRDGVEALHRISTRHYDVVVLDLRMPHMSGIDVLDSLQVLAFDDPPAVLVVTGEPIDALGDGDIERRCPSVVRGVLRKPVDIGRLAESVETLCSR
jgi:CheY-like chemotaxis protein